MLGARNTPSGDASRSFYVQLRSANDDTDLEQGNESPGPEDDTQGTSSTTPGRPYGYDDVSSFGSPMGVKHQLSVARKSIYDGKMQQPSWTLRDEHEPDNDVPSSLLVESNNMYDRKATKGAKQTNSGLSELKAQSPTRRDRLQVGPKKRQHRFYHDNASASHLPPNNSVLNRRFNSSHPKERALWRWVNTSNLDSFIRDIYNYYEGGGMWCILCCNALWLIETLFVAVLLTFLTQCIDYKKVPDSKSLDQVIIGQCTRKMSSIWNIGIWLYSLFFIWKAVQYFLELRRLTHIRDFYTYLLEIPEQDMQTVSWQDVVARIMALREQNPKTASNISPRLRRFMGSQSKERLDAHDIANRLMRKENYLIAMINKDVLNLSLPFPFLQRRQLFSKTMEWYLHYGILDMAFNEFGQVQQDFLRTDRRRLLSKKLRQRLVFAGVLNLVFAPVVLAYVVIVYFFTYYNEYQKDPKLAAARKYTSLAEWKFREFNELPHIFYERLHMSYPFATRYVEQFPKRITEEVARSIAFMSGAITAVLAVCTVLDSDLFLGFEITPDRTVLFYLGVFGAIWAMTRGMVSEETRVFDPEYALRSVIEYTRHMPDHWEGRLHSFEVKQEFSELYKMKVVIFLEEIMGIITTPMLLLFSLPKCSDQIVDFFREFTIHVDGLGYVCSFAVFDFKKGLGNTKRQAMNADVRRDYYSTKHGKMAASYYGFLDNYFINPKTGIPGHLPPTHRPHFHPPPTFPSLNSPTLATELQNSTSGRVESKSDRANGGIKAGTRGGISTLDIPLPSPMASMLLDPHHQPSSRAGRMMGKPKLSRASYPGEQRRILEEPPDAHDGDIQPETNIATGEDDEGEEQDDVLGESAWQTSPGHGLSRENSAANPEEPEGGVLGLIYQLRQTKHGRRGGVI